MNTLPRQEKVIDSHSKQEEVMNSQGIHAKVMDSPQRQEMEGFLQNLTSLNDKKIISLLKYRDENNHRDLFASHLQSNRCWNRKYRAM